MSKLRNNRDEKPLGIIARKRFGLRTRRCPSSRGGRAALAAAVLWAGGSELQAAPLADLMPRTEDRTSMWWRDGFPEIANGTPWHRCVETGRYGFILDTESLTIPHFGPAGGPLGRLPKADLALEMVVDGKSYRCSKGGEWSRFAGPRLIESGPFFQRADVTDLVFTAEDGSDLNVEARFETAAWPDRLALILAARPGQLPIVAGDDSFGRVQGGFGLDGTNRLEIPAKDCPTPEKFTLEFWVFIPHDYKAGKHSPWLVCKNGNEQVDGHYGIVIQQNGLPDLRMNIGGGRANSHRLMASPGHALKFEEWNHLALSFDGGVLRLYANGRMAAEQKIGKTRIPRPGGMTFGGRQDGLAGFPFRGVADEIRLYDRALTLQELRLHFVNPELDRPALKPVREWRFRPDVAMSRTRLSEKWSAASMQFRLGNGKGELKSRWDLPKGAPWIAPDWHQAALMVDPATFQAVPTTSPVTVTATEVATGSVRPVVHDPSIGWHRVNLDGVEPIPPPGGENPSNDAIERVKLVLSNPTDREQIARLMFEKTSRGFRQRIGSSITGISAILRDADGKPTGIPVQLSKNWHAHPEGGVYSGAWFHGISQVRLPPKRTVELELTLAYGHWGGVAAASHAQLSLIGWGANQLWDESALGSWGESICYEPEQVQAKCAITDVRPVMVRSKKDGVEWNWTNNVGGGDFFRFFDSAGQRAPHARMRAFYHRVGPCLTEVTYAGQVWKTGIHHRATVSLARSDDLVCGSYRIRMDVTQPADFSRLVLFQIGADTYSPSKERKMAVGDETGLLKEWETQWGGNAYRGKPLECTGRIPWVSLHESDAVNGGETTGARANRGIVIREWKARLGGKEAKPWISERGLDRGHSSTLSSTLDILPPPGVTRLLPGDFVEATIEHIIMPQFARDYYGPNEALRTALRKDENTWRMIHRQAMGDDLHVETTTGTPQRLYPDVRIATAADTAEFTLKGGLGYVPVTFTGLTSHADFALVVDGQPVDQGIHGNDFWQTDYDPASKRWSRTYTLPLGGNEPHTIRFSPEQ